MFKHILLGLFLCKTYSGWHKALQLSLSAE